MIDLTRKLVFAFDLDGTLTEETGEEPWEEFPDWQELYARATPSEQTIWMVNLLHKYGIEVVIYTARPEEDRDVTEKWLFLHGVQYDELVMGKRRADVYVDSDSMTPDALGEFLKTAISELRVRSN